MPNGSLIQQLAPLADGISINCIHVKGHADDVNNTRVDRMAKDRLSLRNQVTIATLNTTDWSQEPDILAMTNSQLASPKEDFAVLNGDLYYLDPRLPEHSRLRRVVPKSQRKLLIRYAHDDPITGSHYGVKKTRNKLIEYYWPGQTKDIEHHVLNCDICQRNKQPHKLKMGLMQYIPVAKVFERIHIDIVGPLTPTKRGKLWIITCVDALSRYAYATAKKEVNSAHIIEFLLREIIYKHGIPAKLVSDNGTQFVSQRMIDFTTRFNIQHSRTCDYHPAANGRDERFNGTLSHWIRNYVNLESLDWDLILPLGLLAYNTSPH